MYSLEVKVSHTGENQEKAFLLRSRSIFKKLKNKLISDIDTFYLKMNCWSIRVRVQVIVSILLVIIQILQLSPDQDTGKGGYSPRLFSEGRKWRSSELRSQQVLFICIQRLKIPNLRWTELVCFLLLSLLFFWLLSVGQCFWQDPGIREQSSGNKRWHHSHSTIPQCISSSCHIATNRNWRDWRAPRLTSHFF